MKIFYKTLVILPLLFSAADITAQKKQPVRFANGDFFTGNNISSHSFTTDSIKAALSGNEYFVLLQFSALPSEGIKQKMSNAGISLYTYYPGNAWLASIKNNFDFSKAGSFNISSINVIPAAYKIHKKLPGYRPTAGRDEVQAMAISYFGVTKETVLAALNKAGAFIATEKYEAANIILIQYNRQLIDVIAAWPFVNSISLQPMQDHPLNYNSRAVHGISGLNAWSGKNLNGKNVTIGIGDNSDVSTHIDFTGRLINRTPTVPADHGTHTTGTAAGGGIINIKNRGFASKATIVNNYFSDIILNTPAYMSDYNMVVTNNSYHSANDACDGEGEYNILSNYGDNQLHDNDALQHVFASGNDGELTCSVYPPSFGTVKSGWQTGKNILTVGALSIDGNYTIASFSSRGPAADGRIKPEITADGSNVISTLRYNTYGAGSGTSMAAPAVTGALTLMYERYRQLHGGANPKSALMKALACNTAEDLGSPGPDYTYGFGMLNGRKAVEAIDSNRYFLSGIANAGNNTHNIVIPPNTYQVKIMLYWNDVPAASNAATALVNDLDLMVTEPLSIQHFPLTLTPLPSFVQDVAAEGPDHLNNIEQVVINNPAAGTYIAAVNGYNIPSGTQQYVLTYEIIKNSVTVEYPFGGETLVPGETENIRWNAYGNNSNNFTIEYSSNNGSNWTTISNSVAASSRMYSWTVPSTITNNGLIRISRNGTGLVDQSNFNFTVLGQPIDTVTSICQGAVQLKWSAVPGATSYDVLQLIGDSMRVIANTASSPFIIKGLNKSTRYWFGTAAKNNTVSGRRSVSVTVVPGSGACTLSDFDNDLKIDTILEPVTARQFFSNAADATKPVKVIIRNLGTVAANGPYNVSFDYGGTVVTETVNTAINAGGSLTYTFNGTYPVVPSGYQYHFKAWVTKAADNNHLNDTAYKTVKYINNDPVTSLPLTEDFESMPAISLSAKEMAVGGNKYLDFSADSSLGRASTFVNTGFALSGNRALTLDQFPVSTTRSIADSAIFNYNLSQYAGKQIRFDFYYKNHGQENYGNNKIWVHGSENGNWIEAYNLFDNQAGLGEWKKGVINISEVLAGAGEVLSPTFQIKLVQNGLTSANSPHPIVADDDGYTFDNLTLSEAINDVATLAINSPDKNGCSLTASNPISIKIKNYQNTTLNNVQVSYQVNNGAVVTETIPSIAANQTLDYTFTQRANLAADIDYNINVWTKYAADNYASNDSILNYSLHNTRLINSYPYMEGFENDNGGYYTSGTNTTWQWGTPSKTNISKAPNGNKIWTTSLTGNYADNETSYLVSPCFDLTGLRHPVLSFSHLYDVETDYDYTWVEYTTDGKTWNKLGDAFSGTNWYDNAAGSNWRYSNTKWHVASIDIPVTNTTIHFRFVMSSDGGVTQEGVGIDDIRIFERTAVPGSVVPAISQNVSGNNWVPFTSGDSINGPWYVLAEINPNGQNLGAVTVTPYINTSGIVRNSNNQYYADRNYVLTSTGNPTGSIGIRLYFTDAESNAMLGAGTCGGCGNPADAYELGVDKYKGSPAEENGTLLDNFNGYFNFILPANTQIIPHNNGYYAEFTVNSLSEFWFSKGDITPPTAGSCPNNIVSFSEPQGAGTYQWQVNDGTGYVDLTNAGFYSGATTNTLQIIGIPTSFTGYKYRCLVNEQPREENILRFKNLWIGNTSSDWFTASNWGCGFVPDQYTDAIIAGTPANNPVISTNTAVRSIRVMDNVPVLINEGIRLEVRGK